MSAQSDIRYCDVCGGLVSDAPHAAKGEDVGLLCETCLTTRRVLPDAATDEAKAEKKGLMRFRCPHCDRRLRTKSVRARVEIGCPKCSGLLVLLPGGGIEAGVPQWPTAPGHAAAGAPSLGPAPSDLTDAIDAGAFEALGASDSGAHRIKIASPPGRAPAPAASAPPPRVETSVRAARADSSSSGRSERAVSARRPAVEEPDEEPELEPQDADEEEPSDEEGDGQEREPEPEYENENENDGENENENENENDGEQLDGDDGDEETGEVEAFEDPSAYSTDEGAFDGEVTESEGSESPEVAAPARASRLLLTLALLVIVSGLGGAFAARTWQHPPAQAAALGDRVGAGYASLEARVFALLAAEAR